MKSSILLRLLLFFSVAVLGAAGSYGQDIKAVRARMDARQQAVDALRGRGVAGENNLGYLEARGGASAADQKVIAEENADRRAVYNAVAAQDKSTADAVGRRRAQKIASMAGKGVWIQDESGRWSQK